MAVRTEQSIFYHIPKCGGIWVKEAIRQGGLRYDRCRYKRLRHPFGLKREHATPGAVRDEDKAGRFSFCFVRHPVGWLQSFWCYRVKTGWLDNKFPADHAWEDHFELFVLNVLDAYPGGFVSQLYQYYVGQDAGGMDFIGRQESLADDLVRALTLAGEQFDEEALRATRWRNIAARGRKFRTLCTLSDELRARVIESEQWVLETFYV